MMSRNVEPVREVLIVATDWGIPRPSGMRGGASAKVGRGRGASSSVWLSSVKERELVPPRAMR